MRSASIGIEVLEGHGIMKADASVLKRFYDSESATLQLEDGSEITIIRGDLDLQRGRANFVTTGAIPGF
jgi:hypothetical protein